MTVTPEGFWEDAEHWIGDGEARSTAEDPQVYEDEVERMFRNLGPLPEDGDPRAQRVMGIIDL